MSDGLTSPPPSAAASGGLLDDWQPAPARAGVRRIVIESLGVLLAFAAVGAAAGWFWEWVWTPPSGAVREGQWFYDDYASLGMAFDATALYILIGAGAGLVLGVLASLFARRSGLATLVAVAAGSALAAFLCYRVGLHLAPTDPATLATGLPDGTELPGALEMPGKSPYVFWPLGALIGLAVTNVFAIGWSGSTRREATDPAWLARSRNG